MRLAALLLVAALAGCGSSSPPSFVESARSAKTLTIYEGVPRDAPAGPTDRPTRTIADQTVLSAVRTASGPDAEAIRKLLADPSVFKSHIGGKKCGGFHADYVVEWPGPQGPRQVLLCFGCGEARSIGDGSDSLVDLTDDGEARLEAALAKVTRSP